MKKILLATALLASLAGFSQTVANTAPDLQLCDPTMMGGDEPYFDLTDQDPIILGDQDPGLFTVTYFHGEYVDVGLADPETNTNPIDLPENFTPSDADPITIHARVTNNDDGSYAITTFTVQLVFVYSLTTWPSTCDGYHVPWFNIGGVYTEPGGAGTLLEADAVLTEPTGTLYFYAEMNGCIIEGEIEPMADMYPFTGPLEPMILCDENLDGNETFDLTSIIPSITEGTWNSQVTFHHSYQDAELNINPIENPSQYQAQPVNESIYVRKTNGDCESITSMDLVLIACEGNSFSGTVSIDAGDNDCTEGVIPAEDIVIVCNGDGYTFFANSSEDGSYTFLSIPEGDNIISVQSPVYLPYVTTPEFIETDAAEDTTGNNFCITGSEEDNLSLLFLPVGMTPRPGFNSGYLMKLRNEGANNLSGTIVLTFDDNLLDFVSADSDVQQSGNALSFDYEIAGLQSQYINLTFLVMQPPTAEGGDVLEFTAILADVEDLISQDNVSSLEQVIVNSMDPNDITVHEGESITPEQAAEYLHYTIRFQNVGTASAIHVRIEGMLDDKLDWDTFQPLASSHSYQINRAGNDLEFMYSNINLPDSLSNETGSHGYITYRVKPKSTVQVNDVISASANIFFDFNAPVATNVATTMIEAAAGIRDRRLQVFTAYPNPADDAVNIVFNETVTGTFEVKMTDLLGKTVLSETISGTDGTFDVSELESGVYFISIGNKDGNTIQKIIIE